MSGNEPQLRDPRQPDSAPGRLHRAALQATGRDVTPAPIRIVHIGLGSFAKAHQAWYTARADDHAEWGIAAFTVRSSAVAEQLAPQDGLFTLIERGPERDRFEIVDSIVEVNAGACVERFVELLESPAIAIVTLTITEPGYRLRADGVPDLEDPAVQADLEVLRDALQNPQSVLGSATPQTPLARLVLGLAARRRAGGGPISVVPCDNVPENGLFVRRGVISLAETVSPEDADWISQNVSFVSTSVDRITPRTTPADVETVLDSTGWFDAAPVVTEPFSSWVLSGEFPAGRPAWESSGAQFVDEIEPFERRKLWLLNGAHSLLAYRGIQRGYRTVAEAIGDETLRSEVETLWDEDVRHLPATLDLGRYRDDLQARYQNSRIEHQLAQIALEGATKLRVRFPEVALAERQEGRTAKGCATVIAAWLTLVLNGKDLGDAQSDTIQAARTESDPVVALILLIDPRLTEDDALVTLIRNLVHEYSSE